METFRTGFLVRLQKVEDEKEALRNAMDRVILERDILCRQNKRIRASFLFRGVDENNKLTNQYVKHSLKRVLDTATEAMIDYKAADVETRAERKKTDFQSRIGSRLGSYKYAEWLRKENN